MPSLVARCPLMNPRRLRACRPVTVMISASVAPFFCSRRPKITAFLLPVARCGGLLGGLGIGGLLGLACRFGLRGLNQLIDCEWFALGRYETVNRFPNSACCHLAVGELLHQVTPVSVFHISMWRAPDQLAATVVSSFSEEKLCSFNFSSAPSGAVPFMWAVMLLSASITNVMCFLGTASLDSIGSWIP